MSEHVSFSVGSYTVSAYPAASTQPIVADQSDKGCYNSARRQAHCARLAACCHPACIYAFCALLEFLSTAVRECKGDGTVQIKSLSSHWWGTLQPAYHCCCWPQISGSSTTLFFLIPSTWVETRIQESLYCIRPPPGDTCYSAKFFLPGEALLQIS